MREAPKVDVVVVLGDSLLVGGGGFAPLRTKFRCCAGCPMKFVQVLLQTSRARFVSVS
jgi:hypothetical protein